jgi:hypothetical protein
MREFAPSLLPDDFRETLGQMPDSERGVLLDTLVRVASLMEADATGAIEGYD